MGFSIGEGISETELPKWLKDAADKYGIFEDGRVNYKEAEVAPIVMCVVRCDEEILLVKRGFGLADAEGYWSTINGFIDENKPVVKQAIQELEEELGLKVGVEQVISRRSYLLNNAKEKRQYVVFPCLATLSDKPKIKLDRENTDFAWVSRNDVESYEILDDLPYAIDTALGR